MAFAQKRPFDVAQHYCTPVCLADFLSGFIDPSIPPLMPARSPSPNTGLRGLSKPQEAPAPVSLNPFALYFAPHYHSFASAERRGDGGVMSVISNLCSAPICRNARSDGDWIENALGPLPKLGGAEGRWRTDRTHLARAPCLDRWRPGTTSYLGWNVGPNSEATVAGEWPALGCKARAYWFPGAVWPFGQSCPEEWCSNAEAGKS